MAFYFLTSASLELNSLEFTCYEKQLVNDGKKPIALMGSFNVFSKIQIFLYAHEAVSILSLTLRHCYTAVIYRMVSLEIIIYEEHIATNLLFRNKP